jgi:hypothetical protein
LLCVVLKITSLFTVLFPPAGHTELTDMYGKGSKMMCQFCGTVIVCDWSPHSHYISAHSYQYVR